MKAINLSASKVDELADWLEVLALAKGGSPVGLQAAQSIGLSHFGIEDESVSSAFQRSLTRSKDIGPSYPFSIESNYIVGKANARQSLYANMLYLSSTSPLRQADGWNLTSATKDFENIVELAISAFFGSSTKTLNFGFPSQFGRPADFPNAVAWLAGKLGIKLGSAYRSPRRKDGGVDIFVWKNFPDSFGGKPVGLVQATIMEDFRNKIADIDTKLWSSWLAIDTDPLVVLAIPTIENDRNIWSELSSRGTLLDRRRLAQMQPEGLLYENTRLELALADFEGTFL